ncbi:MAG: SDR family oxidoreductase [Thermodesulfobacteriota bacterium]
MTEKARKVLVMGGAGYIGSVLTRLLVERGYETTVFDRLLFGTDSLSALEGSSNFRLIEGDLRHTAQVSTAIEGQDAVILLAALVGEPACNRDPRETVDVNYLGTLNVIEAARYHGVSRLIFASTDSCYGLQEGILSEDSPLKPISLYAELKRDVENRLLSVNGTGFSPTVLRLATVYGLSPRMRFDLIINILTMHAVKYGRIKIHGGRQWRPLVHVADAARGFLAALEAPLVRVRHQVFNIGSNLQNYRIGQLGDLVAAAIPGVVIETIDQPPDLRDYHVNFDKVSRILDYKVERTVADAVAEIAEVLRSGAIEDPLDPKYRNT